MSVHGRGGEADTEDCVLYPSHKVVFHSVNIEGWRKNGFQMMRITQRTG